MSVRCATCCLLLFAAESLLLRGITNGTGFNPIDANCVAPWVVGNGNSKDILVGNVNTPQECSKLVKIKQVTANGATLSTKNPPAACYAELGQTSVVRPNHHYYNCKFPPMIGMNKEGAKKACKDWGWKTVMSWKSWSSSKAIICTKPGTSGGDLCNSHSTWRLLVFKDGGTSQCKKNYGLKAGNYYGGHKPCKCSASLQNAHGGTWFPATKANAESYCKKIGWNVRWVSGNSKSLICAKGKTSQGSNCSPCSTWRLIVWEKGGQDQSPAGQTYSTSAGSMYGGHKPCKAGNNLPVCGSWTTLPVIDNTKGVSGKQLSVCQGDCDSDGDCNSGFRCNQRGANDPEPSCSGSPKEDWDYCVPK